MKDIPDKSIDLVLTDPPYGVNKAEWDKYLDWKMTLKLCGEYIDKKIKENGVLICFTSTRFLADTLTFFKTAYRWQFIWYASNNMIPGDIGFAKYTSALIFSNAKSIHHNLQDLKEYPAGTNELKENFHPTPKPLLIIQYLIDGFTKEGDLILDPFSGSGTTAIACHKMNRRFICIEKEKKYVDLSRQRLKDEQAQMSLF
jgi:site-specific DNA-methyltransferase (adenine-specific)